MTNMLSRKISPDPIHQEIGVVDLIDRYFTAYNSARLREICHLLCQDVLQDDVTVGLSLSGAMTPAGFGMSAIAPLMQRGFVDYIISTGANLYHDIHYALGLDLYASHPFVDDAKLRREGRIRIYDIVFDYDVLLETDAFLRNVLWAEPFQKRMSTAEFHYLLGQCLWEVEQQLGHSHSSLLATAYQCGVPIYTSSPGDSSIGMNVAAIALEGSKLVIDPSLDVNETAALVYGARDTQNGQDGKSAAIILGGGSPKNFLLQTQPQIHEVLGLEERGHDFFVQITDARPDTGGLSGATPSEAVSWGKVDPEELPSTIVCYTDSTIALPIITAYVMNQVQPRPLKRLYDRREELLERLQQAYRTHQAAKQSAASTPSSKSNESNQAKEPIGAGSSSSASATAANRPATYPCGTPIRQRDRNFN
jgi:deoxyhypusine synthase